LITKGDENISKKKFNTGIADVKNAHTFAAALREARSFFETVF